LDLPTSSKASSCGACAKDLSKMNLVLLNHDQVREERMIRSTQQHQQALPKQQQQQQYVNPKYVSS